MAPPFTRAEIEPHQVAILNHGRFNNAVVRLCRIRGEDWVVKDFRPKFCLVRWTTGRFFMGRELKALQRLQGLPGIPQDAFRVDANAVAYRHMPGKTLPKFPRHLIPADFFPRLEQMVHAMHARNVAHLDLRYRHNVLVLEDGSPGIIDFQSFISLNDFPAWFQNRCRQVDLSGVYKQWNKRAPSSLDETRRTLLSKQERLRPFWILKGYFGLARKCPPPSDRPPTPTT